MPSTLSSMTHVLLLLHPPSPLTLHVLLEISNSEQVWPTVLQQETLPGLEGKLCTLFNSFNKHIPSTYSVPSNVGTQDQSPPCLTLSTVGGDWGESRHSSLSTHLSGRPRTCAGEKQNDFECSRARLCF